MYIICTYAVGVYPLKKPYKASVISDAIQMIDIAWWREILLLFCKLWSFKSM